MKKPIKIVTLLVFGLFLTASFYQDAPPSAVLTGNLAYGSGKQIILGSTKIDVAADGSFSYEMPLSAPAFYDMSYAGKKIELFISPGDSLQLDLSVSNVQITGTGADVNLFLQAHKKLARANSKFLDDNNKLVFGAALADFQNKIDSLKLAETKLLDAFVAQHPALSPRFSNRLNTDIDYRHRRYHLLYPHNYFRHHDYAEIAKVSMDYHDRIMKGSFEDSTLLNSFDYIRCMNRYLDVLSIGKYKLQHQEFAPGKRINARFDAIIGLRTNPYIQDFLIREHFNAHLWTYRIEALDYSIDKLGRSVKNAAIETEIRELYQIAQGRRKEAHDIKLYRKIGDVELNSHLFFPTETSKNERKPAHLFFHGGGWAIGMPEWSYEACKQAASEGRVGVAFDYRLRHVHGTGIRASVSDALAAIAWVRKHADDLGIDPGKILVEGFSSGGHLALMAAMIDDPANYGVDSKYSSKPDALILGATPYDVTHRDVYDIDYDAKLISPLYRNMDKLPPMLVFHGEEDHIVAFSEFQKFVGKMETTKNDFTHRSFPGGHFYFRSGSREDADMRKKMRQDFLLSNGYLEE